MNPYCSPCIRLQVNRQHRRPSLDTARTKSCIRAFCIPRLPHLSLWVCIHPHAVGQGITYHRRSQSLWCFSFWPQCFLRHKCNWPCQKAGLAWWSGCDRWWCKNFGLPRDRSPLRSSATQPWGFKGAKGRQWVSTRSHHNGHSICEYIAHPESVTSQGTSWRTHLRHTAKWNKTGWQKHGRTPFTPTLSFRSPSFPPFHTTAVLPCLENINAFSKTASYCTETNSCSMLSESEARDKEGVTPWDHIYEQKIPLQHQKPAEISPILLYILSN